MVVQHLHGSVAKAALGHVDDALEGEVVGSRTDHPQISQRVADFGALIESWAADYAVGQAKGDEAILEFAHLERGAHQNRNLVELVALALQLLDFFADGAGLLFGVPGAGHGDLLAVDLFGAQSLAEPAFIIRDQMRGGGKDVTGRAVIALEPNDLRAGEVVLEAQDVVDLRPAPAINRLIVIADAADVLGGRGGRGDLLPLPVLHGVETSRARSERVGVRGSLREHRLCSRLPLTRCSSYIDLSPRAGGGKGSGASL